MFEVLRTERLVLRPYQLDDAEARWQAIEESRDHLRRYEPEQAASCHSLAEAQVWIIQANADWLMRKRFAISTWAQATDQYVGGIGLRPGAWEGWSVPAFELGYWVRASAQGQGYVTEAVGSVTAYALEQLHAQRVEIRCEASNDRSAAVARRLGFRLEGHLRNIARQADGTLIDELIYALIPTDERPR
jgi:RimJ/RimL family protein N-acetyltransferase